MIFLIWLNEEDSKDYLKKRGLTAEEVKKFKIGFVLKGSEIYEKFIKEFEENKLKETGLFYFDEKKKKYIERFRERIIFPINNIGGDIIGFGGRVINDSLPKYINTKEYG